MYSVCEFLPGTSGLWNLKLYFISQWFLKKLFCVPLLEALVVSHSARQCWVSGFRADAWGNYQRQALHRVWHHLNSRFYIEKICRAQLWKQNVNFTRAALPGCVKSGRCYETGSMGGKQSSQPRKKPTETGRRRQEMSRVVFKEEHRPLVQTIFDIAHYTLLRHN